MRWLAALLLLAGCASAPAPDEVCYTTAENTRLREAFQALAGEIKDQDKELERAYNGRHAGQGNLCS